MQHQQYQQQQSYGNRPPVPPHGQPASAYNSGAPPPAQFQGMYLAKAISRQGNLPDIYARLSIPTHVIWAGRFHCSYQPKLPMVSEPGTESEAILMESIHISIVPSSSTPSHTSIAHRASTSGTDIKPHIQSERIWPDAREPS